jgi:hypothetical protein
MVQVQHLLAAVLAADITQTQVDLEVLAAVEIIEIMLMPIKAEAEVHLTQKCLEFHLVHLEEMVQMVEYL